MAYSALPNLKKNSPPALTTGDLTTSSTTIPVDHLEYFSDSAGNLITSGIVLGADNPNPLLPEEITITARSGTSGAGNLTGATRGVNADGSIGAAYAWPAGTNIAVNFSLGIYTGIQNNFTDLNSRFSIGMVPIGIEYDFSAAQPSPTLRIIDINGNTLSSGEAAIRIALNPLFAGIKRCNLSDNGTVNAWWGDSGFSYTGSNGQCMTRYPMGYFRQDMEIGTSVKRWRRWVSPVPWGGFRPAPAFVSNGEINSEFYVGTFPANIYDATAGSYFLNDEAYTAGNTNMLSSIAGEGGVGAKPASGKLNTSMTKTVFRTFAQNRGTGWNLWGFNQIAWIELLTCIKYGTFNLQATFPGVSNITDDGSTNMTVRNGATAGYGGITGAVDLGNTDGQVTVAHYQTGQTTYPFNLLALEDPYSNIWQWVGYLKAHNNILWIADHDDNEDTTYPYTAPFVNQDLTLSASNDWTTQVAQSAKMDYGFLPSVGGGSSSTGLTDNYYQAAGDRAALFGGSWNNGARAGAFFWILSAPASFVDRYVGARLCFFS